MMSGNNIYHKYHRFPQPLLYTLLVDKGTHGQARRFYFPHRTGHNDLTFTGTSKGVLLLRGHTARGGWS